MFHLNKRDIYYWLDFNKNISSVDYCNRLAFPANASSSLQKKKKSDSKSN